MLGQGSIAYVGLRNLQVFARKAFPSLYAVRTEHSAHYGTKGGRQGRVLAGFDAGKTSRKSDKVRIFL